MSDPGDCPEMRELPEELQGEQDPATGTEIVIAGRPADQTGQAAGDRTHQHRHGADFFQRRIDEGIDEQAEGCQGRREEVEMSRHWIAAGSKDGKVSLWVVY